MRVWEARRGAEVATLRRGRGVAACAAARDGRCLVLGSGEGALRLWDAQSAAELVGFPSGAGISAMARGMAGGLFACGDRLGGLYLLQLMEFELGPPQVTPGRLRGFGQGRPWRRAFRVGPLGVRRGTGRSCFGVAGAVPVAPAPVLDAIRGLARAAGMGDDQPPSVSLPDEVWEEPGLLSECPRCRQPLRFNPFVVDSRDRYAD